METSFFAIINASSNFPFLIDKKESLSFAQFQKKVLERSAALKKHGLQRDQFIGLQRTQNVSFFIDLFSLWHLGAIAVPFSPKAPALDIKNWEQDVPLSYLLNEDNIEKRSSPKDSLFNDQTTRPCLIILTSGSSGRPKGVALSKDNLYYSALGSNQFYNLQSKDRWGLTLPPHHIAGIMIALRCFLARASIILNSDHEPLASFIKKEHVTFLSLVPHQVMKLFGHDLNLKAVLVGGAPLSETLRKKAREFGLPLSPTYGLSEMSSQVTAQHPRDFLADNESFHLGQVLPYRDLSINQEKRIVLRGKTSFLGYVTQRKLLPSPAEWITQDLGELSSKGELYVNGRADQVFISGGENINPYEIEKVLEGYPSIEETYVVPVNHPSLGKIPYAFYKAKEELSPQKLSSFLKERIHPFKIPPFFHFMKTFHHEGLKIKKKKLEDLANFSLSTKLIGDPSRPLLVFLHGFMGSHQDWEELATYASKDYYCLLIDLPGHGQTSPQSFQETSSSLLTYIKTISNKPCDLLGYSLGGRLALNLLSSDPDQFRKVIVESCHPGLESESLKKERKKQDEQLLQDVHTEGEFESFLHKWYHLPLFGKISQKKRFPELLLKRKRNSLPHLKRAITLFSLGNQNNLLLSLKINKTPLLYISGEDDHKYTGIGKHFTNMIPQSVHKIIPHVAHNTHFEDPQTFREVVLSFLKNGDWN